MEERPHILVVDDDPELRTVLRRGLEPEGFRVVEASDQTELFRSFESHPIRLITLDIGLGSENGLELARKVRATRNVPIIMLTGRGAPIDRVNGLERGADDYITKPFHIKEVVLRIRKVLQRYKLEALSSPSSSAEHEKRRYRFDDSVLDMTKREVRRAEGALIELTETEFNLLALFLRHPGRVFSRDEINNSLRGRDWSPLERTLDGHVARLRRKIESSCEEPRMIKSVRGVGYVFTAEVNAD